MGSLSAARAELAHLERRELQLLQELSDIRKALAAQKVVLDELVKTAPDDVDERTSLASVSCRWRAVLISIPSIWSVIDLDAGYDCPTLELHLERSRQAPLTIIIGPIMPELDVILPHANRWHTLRVLDFTGEILNGITHITCPSLQYLSLCGAGLSLDGMQIIRSWVPALKHLELGELEPPLRRPLCQIIPAESLEELSITSSDHNWKLKEDSIHFPSLRRLALGIRDPIPFLEAIVAPKLASFCFTPGRRRQSVSKTFTGARMKFNNVSHLALSSRYMVDEDTLVLLKLLCQIFCGIRHADVHVGYVPTLFTYYSQRPVDHWTCIESLDIQNLALGSSEPFRRLVAWFEKRRRIGQRKLHLKLTCERVTGELVMLNTSDTLFRKLQECCASVVLDRIPVSPQVYLPTSASSLSSASTSLCILGWWS